MTNTNDNVTRVFRALERDPSAMKDMLRKGEDEVISNILSDQKLSDE